MNKVKETLSKLKIKKKDKKDKSPSLLRDAIIKEESNKLKRVASQESPELKRSIRAYNEHTDQRDGKVSPRVETRPRSRSDTSAMLSVVRKEQKNPTVGEIIEEDEDDDEDVNIEEESTTTEDNYSGEFSSSSEDPFRKTHLDRLFEAGQPIIKAGTINAIVDWLWGCSGNFFFFSLKIATKILLFVAYLIVFIVMMLIIIFEYR